MWQAQQDMLGKYFPLCVSMEEHQFKVINLNPFASILPGYVESNYSSVTVTLEKLEQMLMRFFQQLHSEDPDENSSQ